MIFSTLGLDDTEPRGSVADVPDPVPGEHELLIQVAAAGVNRADLLQAAGHYPPPPGAPAHLGLEVSGTVTAIGDAVTTHAVGDRVVALLAGGGYADVVVVHEDLALPVPAGVDLVEAGGLMEAACTVWSNLEAADAAAGQTLLIHGGSGGVGSLAIQIGVAMGMRVFATAGGAERARRCEDLGAERGIDHRGEDFVETLREGGGADVILDVVGAAYLERNLAALSTGGALVIIGMQKGSKGELDLGRLLAKRARVIGTTLRARPHAEKAAIVAGVARDVWPLVPGRVSPVVHATYPLAEASSAQAALAEGGVFGKILLLP
ncbi:NAD(P)H-quinone oxidoreductase [Demequina sp. NBRC 110055]|uniref:NAD(P)H-quinone oxidoreductase n=1 Tax=Demequina sp. NBRC 110055 TaxID=1570344 RepID=UPI001F2F1D5D|nr:NAD(P)H-quinone oxidoreductase [Demequina sp. NBRC 110055]